MADVILPDGRVTLATGRVERAGATVVLTPMERRTLGWLVEHAGQTVTHETLLRKVWEYAPGVVSRAPYFTVRRLRAKLGDSASPPILIQTVQGEGYRWSPPAPRAPAPARSNLPLPVSLVGREALLDELLSSLAGHGWLTLWGPPGVGKSALAVCLAAATEREAWFCDLAGVRDAAAALQRLSAVLGLGEPSGEGREGHEAVLRSLEARRAALVVDDAPPGVLDQLRAAQRVLAPSAQVVVTQVRRPREGRAHRVPALSPAEGAALLGRLVPARQSDPDLPALVESLDGLPQALELVSGRLRLLPAGRLAQRGGALSDAALERLLDGAWSGLSGTEQDLLCACAAFASGATLDELMDVSGLSMEPLLDALEELCERCLIQSIEDPSEPEPRFRVLALVRAFTAGRSDKQVYALRQARRTVATCMAILEARRRGAAGGYPALVRRTRDIEAAVALPETELQARIVWDALLAGAPVAERAANASRAVAVARSTGDVYWLVEALLTRIEGLPAASDEGHADLQEASAIVVDAVQSARVGLVFARYLLRRSRFDEAEVQLAIAEGAVPPHQEPFLHHEVLQARLYVILQQEDWQRGGSLVEFILAHRRAFGLDEVPSRNLVSWYDRTGQHAEMAKALELDVTAYARRGDIEREAYTRMNLGYLALQRGEVGARPAFEAAIEVARRGDDRRLEAMARYNLCWLELMEGRVAASTVEATAAGALAAAVGDGRTVALCAFGVAQSRLAAKDSRALSELQLAVATAQEATCDEAYALGMLQLATALHESGEVEVAARHWQETVAELTAKNPERWAEAIETFGALYAHVRGEPGPAQALLSTRSTLATRTLQALLTSR